MKHVKLPAQTNGNYILEGEPPSQRYLLKVFCEGDGNPARPRDQVEGATQEIALALNMYDPFIDICARAYALLDAIYCEGLEGHETWVEGLRSDLDDLLKPLLVETDGQAQE